MMTTSGWPRAKADAERNPSPCDLAGLLAFRSGAGLQFAIDDVVDERRVVDDVEMGALPNVYLQT